LSYRASPYGPPPMECAVLDIGGNILGPALGLRQLGHRVHYWTNARLDCIRDSAQQAGILSQEPRFEAEVLIYAASFSDEQWASELGIQQDAELRPAEPLFGTIHPGQATYRNRWVASQIPRGQVLVLADMGDTSSTVSSYFRETSAIKLKREMIPGSSDPGVLPFPYLYQPHLLQAEMSGILDRLWGETGAIRQQETSGEAFFAGTVGHWRYMGKRTSLLAQWQRQNPDLPLRIQEGGLSLLQTWQELQRCDLALSLPGRGELCFRHHELAALGIPALALEDFHIQVPEAWRQAFPLQRSQVLDPTGMRAFYENHYHPMHAATCLVEAIQAGACERSSAHELRTGSAAQV
jgi:hypothetical protein